MRSDPVTKQVHHAVGGGFTKGSSFLGSILAGTLLGLLADRWLGTEPWLVVVGIIVGTYSGFLNVWRYLEEMDEGDRGR